jgi:glucose-6-phosphate isomerase
MENLKVEIDNIFGFVSKDEVFGYKNEISKHIDALNSKTGKGNDFLGWMNLPSAITEEELARVEKSANFFKANTEIVVVIGIGGSYLGSKAVIEALSHTFSHLNPGKNPIVLFAGQNIGEDYTRELLDVLDKKTYGIVVISKSGTTTEPAIAFRILKNHLENKIGKEKAKTTYRGYHRREKRGAAHLGHQRRVRDLRDPRRRGRSILRANPCGIVAHRGGRLRHPPTGKGCPRHGKTNRIEQGLRQ